MTRPTRKKSASAPYPIRLAPDELAALKSAASIAGKQPTAFAREMIALGLWHWEPKETPRPSRSRDAANAVPAKGE